MSYYRPAGDYKTYGYAGDPGFLSSLWKGIKSVGKGLLGIPPKPQVMAPTPGIYGPIAAGTVAGAGMQYFQPPPPKIYGPGAGARGPSMPGWVSPTTRGMTFPPGAGAQPCPTGYHYAKDGSGRLVRNRRMNVANPKALRRSLRRVQGFEKLVRRTFTISGQVKVKKR